MKIAFLYHSLRRDLSNFSLLKNRAFDGFMVSMHQSGTHWLKHILATALSRKYNLPPPKYSHANEIIGGVKDQRPYAQLPRIASSHSIPHFLLGSSALRRHIAFPPYLVLVRDIRASLVSNYEKWKMHYACDFSTFLRGDVSGRRFNSDIWWCLRFCNAWGRIARDFPDDTLVIKYEDLHTEPLLSLGRVNTFWALGLDEAELEYGLNESSRERMANKQDPAIEPELRVVRRNGRSPERWFNAEDRRFFRRTCAGFLQHDLAYDYQSASFS